MELRTRNDNHDNHDELFQLMKEQMNSEQEQIFMASHYLYLQYGTDNTKFVVDFDDVWKNVDFTRRDNAKRILTKNFIENENYEVSQLAPLLGGTSCEKLLLPKEEQVSPILSGADRTKKPYC